ncbi:hypothetical protein CGLO_07777 [Colletotrichum gloeosporioides Cg-14]|uniref:Uncharacterized protein n=1 Tax=Colletotrichum gloeosporioides (strain Cg-14) TaxID=1237896 RepID=T0KIB4_COLGC|nr:hypothetical protein CGLO_07777 [Colletotrichum gloeosporioides Cg-14]
MARASLPGRNNDISSLYQTSSLRKPPQASSISLDPSS